MRIEQLKRVYTEIGGTRKMLVYQAWLMPCARNFRTGLSFQPAAFIYVWVFIYKTIDARLNQFHMGKGQLWEKIFIIVFMIHIFCLPYSPLSFTAY